MLPLRFERQRRKGSLTSPWHWHVRRPLRLTRYTCLVIILGFSILGFYYLRNYLAKIRETGRIRKFFEPIRDYERRLPQNSIHHPDRMVKFSNEVWGLGLNNQLNNRLILSHLAYLANHAYVFQGVMFGDTYRGNPWYPLNTFISGPTAGGPFPRGILAPRAVSVESWQESCPYYERTFLNVTAVNRELGIVNGVTNGVSVLERWAEKLSAMPDLCVEITWDSKHVIDFYSFGSLVESLSLWSILSTSPVVTAFQWSGTVLNAVEQNMPVITGQPLNYNMDNVLALHLRRGDFESHCTHIAKYTSGYNSWNLLPELPDKYIPPPDPPLANSEDSNYIKTFMRHCWPSTNDVIRRINQVKNDHDAIGGLTPLDTIYILTNGDKPWIAELKHSILNSSPVWKRVTSSHDLSIKDGPEKVAAQAIDMVIASETGSLIGNGFSTLTANVVMFRLLDGKNPQTCRMW